MKGYLLIPLAFLIFVNLGSVHARTFAGYNHTGDLYCIPCHTLRIPDREVALGPGIKCTDKCHVTPYEERHLLHTKICTQCHPKVNGTFQIHVIHVNNTEFDVNIQCRLCHQSPEGYNSSIVHVPPSKEVSKPKWGGNCLYCHVSPEKTERLHDFHKPVLLKNGTCQKCHTDTLKPDEAIYRRIAGDLPEWLKGKDDISSVGDIKDPGDVETYIATSSFYEESLRYLGQIATEMNKIVLALKNEILL